MMERNTRARAVAIALRRQRPDPAPWWLWAALAVGLSLAAASSARGQATVPETGPGAQPVPEVVRPGAPTLPPGAGGDTGLTQPRSETPSVPGPGDRTAPVPDAGVVAPVPRGVITPPLGAGGDTPVIRPPAAGAMPVIPPPGSPGGNQSVVPK